VATKQVNIDIIAKDKTRQAMQSATKGVDGLKSAVFNLKNAFIGLGAGLAIKSFIDVGKQVESLQIRLKFLFGSVEEGSRAFDAMAKYASKVPFSLEQIQAGAGSLAVVSKDAEELAKMLEITGNVASVTGLDFRTASEQISRSFSAGIASADIFRERGVRDLLGFSAGATISTEQTAEAFERVFGKNGTMAGATNDLANTLEGTLSMIGDKFFSFQKIVAESFFVGLKQEFGALDNALKDNQKTIDNIAKAVGKGLSDAVIMAGDAVVFLKDNFEAIKDLAIGAVVFETCNWFY
jgi:phage tail tape-measure protein